MHRLNVKMDEMADPSARRGHPLIAAVGVERDKRPFMRRGRTLGIDYFGLITRGSGSLALPDAAVQPIATGSALWLPAGRWHSFDPAPRSTWTELWLLLWPDRLPAPLAALLPRQPMLSGVADAELPLLWDDLYSAMFFQPPGWTEHATVLLHRILHAVQRNHLGHTAARSDRPLRRMHQLMYGRLNEPDLDVHRLAKAENMTYDRFRRWFHHLVGQSPKQYFLGLKIAYAKDVLLREDRAIADIAAELGITDPYYFSRLFRSRVGMGPRAFRRLGASGRPPT